MDRFGLQNKVLQILENLGFGLFEQVIFIFVM